MTGPRLRAGWVVVALLVGACSSGGDDADLADDVDQRPTVTTASATTTTAPLGPPEQSLDTALLTPTDLPDEMWQWPFGTSDEFRPAPRDRSSVDDITVAPGPCAEVIAAFLASGDAGPNVRELRSADDRLVIEQRVDREPDAATRWDALLEDFPDACEQGTATTPDGARGDAASGNFHVVRVDVNLYPLRIEPADAAAPSPRGYVLFVQDPTAIHVLSVFTTAATNVVTRDGLYDLAVSVAVNAQQKLAATLG